MDSNTGPLYVSPLIEIITDISFAYSKTAPPASIYDEPNQPYTNTLKLVGCPKGPSSFNCLQKVPFDVCHSLAIVLLNHAERGHSFFSM